MACGSEMAELRIAGVIGRPTDVFDGVLPTGDRLYVSHRTVQTHLAHVFTKLGLTSRAQLAAEATRQGSALARYRRGGDVPAPA